MVTNMKSAEKSLKIHTVNNLFSIILLVLILATAAELTAYVKMGVEGRFFIGPFNGDILLLELLLLLEGFLLLRL